MKHCYLLLLLPTAFLVAACNRNPAWTSSTDASKKADVLAEETCKCVYEMMGQEPGWNRDHILEAVKEIRSTNPRDLHAAVLESSHPEIMQALEDEEEFSLKLDDCECMEPVQDALLEQGVDFDAMMNSLDQNCLLGAFYN